MVTKRCKRRQFIDSVKMRMRHGRVFGEIEVTDYLTLTLFVLVRIQVRQQKRETQVR